MNATKNDIMGENQVTEDIEMENEESDESEHRITIEDIHITTEMNT